MEGDTVNGFVDVADKTGTVNSLGGAATILIGGTIPSFNSGIELTDNIIFVFKLGAEEFFDGVARRKT